MRAASRIGGRARQGFTLLEVLLSSLIAVLLFGGLYVAMDVELRQAQQGREIVERSTVSRAIINRIATDLAPSLTPARSTPPASGSGSSSGSSTSATSSGGSSTTSSTAATTSGSSSSSSSSSSASSTTTTGTTSSPTTIISGQSGTPIPLAGGVIGTQNVLVIYTSKTADPRAIPVDPTGAPLDPNSNPIPTDIRRITYWLGSNGGLCRQEMPWFSNDSFVSSNSVVYEPGKSDDDYVIAREVVDVEFEYFDINTTPSGSDSDWAQSWDGTTPGPDGVTPYGPPTAIRVTFTLRTADADGNSEDKPYQHVIPLISSNGPTTSPYGTSSSSGSSNSGTQSGQ